MSYYENPHTRYGRREPTPEEWLKEFTDRNREIFADYCRKHAFLFHKGIPGVREGDALYTAHAIIQSNPFLIRSSLTMRESQDWAFEYVRDNARIVEQYIQYGDYKENGPLRDSRPPPGLQLFHAVCYMNRGLLEEIQRKFFGRGGDRYNYRDDRRESHEYRGSAYDMGYGGHRESREADQIRAGSRYAGEIGGGAREAPRSRYVTDEPSRSSPQPAASTSIPTFHSSEEPTMSSQEEDTVVTIPETNFSIRRFGVEFDETQHLFVSDRLSTDDCLQGAALLTQAERASQKEVSELTELVMINRHAVGVRATSAVKETIFGSKNTANLPKRLKGYWEKITSKPEYHLWQMINQSLTSMINTVLTTSDLLEGGASIDDFQSDWGELISGLESLGPEGKKALTLCEQALLNIRSIQVEVPDKDSENKTSKDTLFRELATMTSIPHLASELGLDRIPPGAWFEISRGDHKTQYIHDLIVNLAGTVEEMGDDVAYREYFQMATHHYVVTLDMVIVRVTFTQGPSGPFFLRKM